MFPLRRATRLLPLIVVPLLLTGCTSTSAGAPGAITGAATTSPAATVGSSDSSVVVSVTSAPAASSVSALPSVGAPGSSAVPTSAASVPTSSAPSTGPAATPAPACYPAACPPVASAGLTDGSRLVAVRPSSDRTVVVLLVGGRPYDQLALRDLGPQPRLTCLAPLGAISCLVSGVPGARTAFGRLVGVAAGRLSPLSPALAGNGGLELTQITSDTLLVTGAQLFTAFGLPDAAAPQGWHTWTLVGRTVTDTGCGAPSFDLGAAPTTAQRGPCTGTPAITGYPAGTGPVADLAAGVLSPSGNLQCLAKSVERPTLFCTIGKADFAVPACTTGQPGIIVIWSAGAAPTLSDCAGDIMVTAGRNVVAYGQLAYADGFGCVIAAAGGVRCTNGSGHGFALGRAAFTTF